MVISFDTFDGLQSVSQSVSMKTFSLSEDRVVVVKSRNGSQYVVIKQKDSDIKYMEFTPNR